MSALLHDMIELSRGPVTPILSKSLRAMFVAAPGKRLIGGDFSGIESRVNAWIANETWKLDAFRALDAGVGPDTYKLAYANAFGIDIEDVTSKMRAVGKIQELACGYQGSIGAYMNMAAQKNVKLPDLARTVMDQVFGNPQWRKAEEQYLKSTNHYGLSADQWMSLKVVVNGWRDSHPRIVQSWWDRQDAAIEAVEAQGSIVSILDGKIQYMCAEGFLWCRGPSGKLLAYANPRLAETNEEYLVDADGEMYPLGEFTADELSMRLAGGATTWSAPTRVQVVFDGKNQKTGAWGKQYLYGGLQCNNDTQMTARELLRCAMINVEVWGYPIVLHVHDELVTEVDEAFGSVEEFQSLMSILPPGIQGLPLAAKAWSDVRYVK